MTDQVDLTRHRLADIPQLMALLPGLVQAGSAPTDPDAIRTVSNPSRPPVSLVVIDLLDTREKADTSPFRTDYELDVLAGGRRQGVLPTLVSWCRLVDEELWSAAVEHAEYGLAACTATCTEAPVRARSTASQGPCTENVRQHWTEPTIAGESSFLIEHLPWMSKQQWWTEFGGDRGEVQRMWRDLRHACRIVDTGPLRCIRDGCSWPIEAVNGGAWYRCTGCGQTWSRLELHKLHERQQPMRLGDVAKVLAIPIGTLKRWKVEHRISPVDRLGGHDVYKLEHVRRAQDRIERGARAHRTRRRDPGTNDTRVI